MMVVAAGRTPSPRIIRKSRTLRSPYRARRFGRRDQSVRRDLLVAIDRNGSSKVIAHFNTLFENHADPWGYRVRWSELRRQMLCLAILEPTAVSIRV